MDANIKYTISNEDLLGVLRTILLFLENLGFKNTCDALQNECLRQGYDIGKSDPAKLVMISSPEVEQNKDCDDSCKFGKTDQCTCITSPVSNQKYLKNAASKKCKYSQTLSSPNNFEDFRNCQNLYNDDYIPPATMESEQPTKILSKNNLNKINKNFENENKLVYKSYSTPSMQTYDSFYMPVDDEETKENIEKSKKYRQFQNDSEKLLGTVTQSSQTMFTTDAETNHPHIIHSLSTTGNKNTKRIVSTTSIIKNTNTYDVDNFSKDNKSVVFNVSDDICSPYTKVVTEICCGHPKSASSIYDENYKKEKETKVHKCVTCNELPNIFVHEDKDGMVNQSNTKNTSTDLDFKKIKKDLSTGDNNLKLQLVQALRWRITQNDSTTRYQVIGSYTRHDLLGLSLQFTPEGKSLPELYLCPDSKTPNPLQEQMARLLNTFASLTFGRDYLCHDGVVSLLVSLIIDNQTLKVKIDSKTRDMLIATLQKLSLRNQQRMLMISSGLLEYLVSYLKANHSSLSKYCMEYSTALFMNLCLHKQARDRLVPRAQEVIGLLSDLLDNKYDYCMPYVNGAIYSLLLNHHINKEAQRLKLDKLIDHHIQNTQGEMHRQLQVILKLHKNEKPEDDCDCDPSVEPEEEGDYLEPELDSEDTLKLQPSGDEFLEKYKILFSVFGSQVYAVRLKCMCLNTDSSRPRSQPLQHKDKSENTKNNQKDSRMMETLNKSTGVRNNLKDFQSTETLSKSSGVKNGQSAYQNLENVSTNTTTKYVTDKQMKLQAQTTLQNNDNKATHLSSLEMYFNEENEDLDPVPFSKTEIVESKQDPSKPKTPDQSQKQNSRQEIFSKVPSVQTRMLNTKRYQNLYNPPPSFTRTIPMQLKPLMQCVDPCLTYCYKQGMSRFGSNGNRNLTCYRESYDNSMVDHFIPSNTHQCKPDCVCCNTRKKYSCNCYNAIRKSINIDDTHLKKNVKSDLTKSAPSDCHCTCITPQSPAPMKVLVSTPKESGPPITPTTQRIQQNSSSDVDFSYNELLCNLCPETIFHVCPNSKVNYHCYDDVFLSRPRILRTPP